MARAIHSTQMPAWVPNFFTVLRLLLVPFVIRAVLTGHPTLALSLFGFAAVTDVIDGALARHFNLISQAGAYLDPIADKVLLSGVYLALAAAGNVPWWLVATIFGRDFYLLLAAVLMMRLTSIRKFPPSVWGKASTFLQIVTAVVWMVRNMLEIPLLNVLSSALLWPCAALTMWSGAHYTWRGIQLARAH